SRCHCADAPRYCGEFPELDGQVRRSADVGFAPFLGLTKTDCCRAAACRIGAHSPASGQAADRGAGRLVAGRA
ncbi:MAG: hypothetical protein QM286_01835, partial [Acidobacteriota bacterium]|nr:hypothetical protein [Acidobacteriota bacterium]